MNPLLKCYYLLMNQYLEKKRHKNHKELNSKTNSFVKLLLDRKDRIHTILNVIRFKKKNSTQMCRLFSIKDTVPKGRLHFFKVNLNRESWPTVYTYKTSIHSSHTHSKSWSLKEISRDEIKVSYERAQLCIRFMWEVEWVLFQVVL